MRSGFLDTGDEVDIEGPVVDVEAGGARVVGGEVVGAGNAPGFDHLLSAPKVMSGALGFAGVQVL